MTDRTENGCPAEADVPMEIERKFLIAYPDTAWLEAFPGAVRYEILQTYLNSGTDEEVRVRARSEAGKAPEFYRTAKKTVTGRKRIERESRLTEEEYRDLLDLADPARRPVRKTRYKLPHAGKHLEIDLYPFWDDRAIAEVELTQEEEEISFPPELRVLREVTDDPAYKNGALAKRERGAADAFLTVGIDIGTTTVSAAVLDTETGKAAEVRTQEHNAAIPSDMPWDRRQDMKKLTDCVKTLLDALLDRHPGIRAIGFTGQMHGIVCIGIDGEALSDLYTWQDGRAGLPETDGVSVCARLEEKTGYRVPSGYGLAACVWLSEHGEIPKGTAKICTVMDAVTASLCGENPVMHATNAASLGLFRVSDGAFDGDALRAAGIDPGLLPRVVTEGTVVGSYRGIPVVCAIGDNQASVYGTVGDRKDTALANFGTGSQISVICSAEDAEKAGETTETTEMTETEVRPFLTGGSVLVSGAALCGGRAYAAAERFFRAYAEECGLEGDEQYAVMNRLAMRGMDTVRERKAAGKDPGGGLHVDTRFCGTRTDASLRGSITGIGEDTFTPELLLAGILSGMAEELYGMFCRMPADGVRALAASGNAVRKNEALRRALGTVFGMEPMLPAHTEEAAWGAAMFAARTAYPAEAAPMLPGCIRYQDGE